MKEKEPKIASFRNATTIYMGHANGQDGEWNLFYSEHCENRSTERNCSIEKAGIILGTIFEDAIFADKVAVDEETVRLRSHLSQLRKMIEGGGAIGRKLDFLMQEMNREANTIGSKASDLQQAQTVVEIKAELEKIREQMQNIE